MDRSNRNPLLLLMMSFVMGATALPTLAQAPKIGDIKKKIEALEAQRVNKEKELKKAEEALNQLKEKTAKDYVVATKSEFYADLGDQLATVLKKYAKPAGGQTTSTAQAGNGAQNQPATAGPEAEAFKELERDLKTKFGPILFDATKKDIKEFIRTALEDGQEQIASTSCASQLRETIDFSVGLTSFEEAWKSKLRATCADQVKLTAIESDIKKIQSDIDALRSQVLANITINVPRGMVPVPGVIEAEFGAHLTQLETKLKTTAGASLENEIKLATATGTEKKTIDAFVIDATEVTHTAYWYFVQQTKRAKVPTIGNEKKPLWPDNKIPAGFENRPITCVNYEDAEDYCEWTGTRLPTEDEWEVAARSGKTGYDGRFWAWGDDYKRHFCNDELAADVSERRKVSTSVLLPVGSFQEGKSPLGIFDLNGNAGEWTSSPFAPRSTFKDVKIGKTTLDRTAFDDQKKVIRGGCPEWNELKVSSIARNGMYPTDYNRNVGFRTAKSASPGIDKLHFVTKEGRLDTRLVDFKPNKKDQAATRRIMAFDRRKERVAEITKLEWNEELNCRGRAHSIMIANRETDPYNNKDEMEAAAVGDDELKDCLPIGLFHTDVDIVKPALKAGTYIVAFKNGGKRRETTTGKLVAAQDAYLFIPKATTDPIVRMEEFGAASAYPLKGMQPSKIEATPGRADENEDNLTLIYSFETRDKNLSLQAILKLKVAKGALADFR